MAILSENEKQTSLNIYWVRCAAQSLSSWGVQETLFLKSDSEHWQVMLGEADGHTIQGGCCCFRGTFQC